MSNGFYSFDSRQLLGKTIEPYVLPEHIQQAFFYSSSPKNTRWQVIEVNPRGRRVFDDTEIPQEPQVHEECVTKGLIALKVSMTMSM